MRAPFQLQHLLHSVTFGRALNNVTSYSRSIYWRHRSEPSSVTSTLFSKWKENAYLTTLFHNTVFPPAGHCLRTRSVKGKSFWAFFQHRATWTENISDICFRSEQTSQWRECGIQMRCLIVAYIQKYYISHTAHIQKYYISHTANTVRGEDTSMTL